MATTATSIKLPPSLKAELEKLTRRSGEMPHAVMVRALAEHVAAAKVRGASDWLALYRFDPVRDIVRLLRIRHQREVAYRD